MQHRLSVPLGLALLATGFGCAAPQPTVSDIQLMENAVKAESQQAQRTIMGLHAEVQGLQRDLGAARAALARAEGELREAQRRLAQEGQAGSAQREELARLREERDRLVQSSAAVQDQLRQQSAAAGNEQNRLQAVEAALERHAKEMAELKAVQKRAALRPKAKTPEPAPAAPVPGDGAPGVVASPEAESVSPRTVIVERGDTLSQLAQKYRVRMAVIKALNRIENTDHIEPGQKLILPEASPS